MTRAQALLRRYLIVGPSWVGDMVMAQALFISLKQRYPDCEIDVVAPDWSLPVLRRMPQIRDGIALPVAHGRFGLRERFRLGRSLRSMGYTHAIVLPRSWKSALVPWFAGVPVRTGYRGEMRFGLLNDIRRLDKAVLRQTVQRYVALGFDDMPSVAPSAPLPVLETSRRNTERLIATLALDLSRPVVCMMPGAEYGPAKQWPVGYYARLAALLVDSGFSIWVLGSAKESVLGERITRDLGEAGLNLCGRTELVDVVDLLAMATQVVTNDSGLMHISAAVGTRLNVIYGSSTPDYTPPLAEESRLGIFYLALSCSPCFKRVCPLGHTNCLNGIDVETVYAKMLR
jgi:lipopolysaccharide heptosyltransferase II